MKSSQLDGASSWNQLRFITVPMLRFSIFFVTITTMIGWLQFFEEPFVMTKGGPLDSTTSVALFIYRNGFQLSKFGYANCRFIYSISCDYCYYIIAV